MTITETIYQILSGHHELTPAAIYRKLNALPEAGKVGMADITLALNHLKENGHAEPIYNDDKGIWLWKALPKEMASDVAEIEQPTVHEPLTGGHHDAECRAKPRKPYTPNKIAGAYTYRGALVIKLDRKAHAKSITLSAKDMAMLTSIFGGTA